MSQMETSMCIFPRKIQQRPRGGPAKRGNYHAFLFRRPRGRRRRPRFSCKFLGAAPHTPFGNYNVILTGGGNQSAGGMQEECGAEGSKEKTLLALYPWTLPKWGSLLVSLRPSQGLDFAKVLCSQSLGIRLACTRRAKRKVRSSTSNLPACFNRRRRLRSCMAVPRPTNFLF